MIRIQYIFIVWLYSINLTQTLAAKPTASVYLDGGESEYAVILCHGRGKHPQWKVVEPLRIGIHERLKYHTLSLQMPAAKKHWKAYVEDFPQAFAEIRQAVRFLQKEKGVRTVYLMGHSMGSRMASAFVAGNSDHSISGLIVAGIRNSGGYLLSGIKNLKKVHIPVLDIYGDAGNGKDAIAAQERRELVSERYTQIAISGAGHKFEAYEEDLINEVVKWLEVLKRNSK